MARVMRSTEPAHSTMRTEGIMRWPIGGLVVALALGLAAGSAAAADGTIVRLDGEVAYVDVGLSRGLAPGATLEVLRTVTAKHPVSGEELVDHFPLGTMKLAGVGGVLSYGPVEKRIARVVKVGDVVRIAADAPAAAPPPAAAAHAPGAHVPAPPAAAALTAEAAAALEVTKVWESTFGRPPSARVTILGEYLARHPDSPYADGLSREIAAFTSMELRMEAADVAREEALHPTVAGEVGADEAKAPAVPGLRAKGKLPARVFVGDPLEVAIVVTPAERARSAAAYVRGPADASFERIDLAPDGDGYFRAMVPAARVALPSVQLFVEVVDVDGRTVSVIGSPTAPAEVIVEGLPAGAPSPGPGHSAVRGTFEFVSFNTRALNDWYMVAESDFMYRIGTVLWSVRSGFGVLYGMGGRVRDLDIAGLAPHPVGFNYGYFEAELRFGKLVGLSGRLLGGQTVRGDGIGAEMRLRIGSETGTSLVVGGSVLSSIGALALLQLQWDAIKGWPMSGTVIVTNQPAGADIGVRLVYEISYRALWWLQPTLRVGYELRNISHGGFSGGLGLVLGW
jgi:hypothetical protein